MNSGDNENSRQMDEVLKLKLSLFQTFLQINKAQAKLRRASFSTFLGVFCNRFVETPSIQTWQIYPTIQPA